MLTIKCVGTGVKGPCSLVQGPLGLCCVGRAVSEGKGQAPSGFCLTLPPGQTVSPQSATNLEVKNGVNCEHSPVDLSKVRRCGKLASLCDFTDGRCFCGQGAHHPNLPPSYTQPGGGWLLRDGPAVPSHLQVVRTVFCGCLLSLLMSQTTLGGCDSCI